MNLTRVGFTFGLLHDLTDDEVQSTFFACFVISDGLRVGGQDLFNDAAEGFSLFTGKTKPLNDPGRCFFLLSCVEVIKPDTEDFHACFVGDLFVADEDDEFFELGRMGGDGAAPCRGS